ncbi:uncharacterized protein [Euwallacea similis]|uniref:uncharacterized protein n=1 Tax=Euwallacea similis TaxID=1736056 RepID=UPI00344CB267
MVLFLIYLVTCVKMKVFLSIFAVLGPMIDLSKGLDTCFVDSQKTFYSTDVFQGDIFNQAVQNGTEFKNFNITKNTAGFDDTELMSYFNFTVANNSLVMSTTDSYKNFAKLAYANEDVAVISLTIVLSCNGHSNDEFMSIIIADSLSHLPEFDQSSYNYTVAMPIMPSLDITYYGTKIEVSEDNFSNKDMTFSIDPDDFTIDSAEVKDKVFKASFSANKVLQFTDSQAYTLTATNSAGNSSSVTLTIYADEDSGLDSPLFQKAHYSFEYSDGALKPKDGVIKVNSIKLNESNYDVEGGNKENFNLTFNGSTGEFTLNLANSLPSTLKGRIVLDLKYTTDASTSTVLLINIAEVVPTFSSGYYEGTYNPDSNTIEWDANPNVSEAVSLTIDESVKTLFTIDQTDYTITPSSKLTADNFDDNGNIIFTLTALSSTDNEAEAVVVISLQSTAEAQLQFEDSYYEASYDANSKVTLNSQFKFKDLTNFTGIKISVDAPYNDNFSIELKDNKWTVKVVGELSKDVLNDNTQLLVPITATKSGLDGSAKTVLLLDLPEKVLIQFSELYYTGTYLQDDKKDSVHLDTAIEITGADGEDVVFIVEGYEKYLNLSCSSDTCQIDVIKKIDDSILTNASHLTIPITATYEDLKSQTVLILDLPVTNGSDAQIEFKNVHYSAQYIVDSKTGKDSVDLNDGPIEFVNTDKLSVTFEFEADYKDNFDLTCNVKTSSCEISVIKKLDNSTLAKSGPLIITVTASTSQEKLTSQTVLVLDLPSDEHTDAQIEFKNVHYSAQYVVDSKTGKDSVDLNDGPIEFDNVDNLSVIFDFGADYKDNFDLTCSVETSSCEISVTKKLDNSTLAKSGPLIITITASASQEKLTSQTVLVLDLPSDEHTDAQIEFKHVHYSAQYIVDSKTGKDSVDLNDGPVEFVNADNLSVTFDFEADYKDNFDLICDVETSSCEISVTKNLNNFTLAKSGPLIITITASASQEKLTSQTVLVLDLPVTNGSDAQIEFKNVHYSAQYNVDSKTGKDSVALNDGPIKFENNGDLPVSFDFEGDFKDNFKLSCNSETSECAPSVIKNLESSVLAIKSQLTITITASTSANALTSQTVLILDLPTTDDPDAQLTFENMHYAAQYIVDPETDKASVNLTENPIKLNVVGDLDVYYEFEDFSDNFNLSCIESTCNVIVTKELENATLASFSQLIITVTAAASAGQITSRTVLILDLPASDADDAQIEFEKTHYAAQYVLESGKYVVKLTEGDIKLNNTDNLKVDIELEDYNKNFELKLDKDSSSYYIEVMKELSDINSTQLILTITATANSGQLTAHTVIILDLPITENTISFKESYYSAYYIPNSLKLADTIVLKSEDFSNLQFSFEDYDDNFEVEPLSKEGQYNVKMKDQLSQSVLEKATEIYVVLVATDSKSKLEASTVLVIKLPLYLNYVFEVDHYDAEYLKDESSDLDKVNVNQKIKIVNPDFTQLSVLGYEENFSTSCNSTTLECSLSLKSNLNSSSLSANELFLTLVASTIDQFSTGRSILLLKLPVKNSSFEFEEQLYQANYNIQSSEDELGTISLVDAISLKGAYATDISIVCDKYFEYFKFELAATGWELQLQKNIEAKVLSGQSQLITSLTASNSESTSFAKAAFIVNFPNETSVAFNKLQYFGDYISGDSPNVTMEDNIVVSDPENSQIALQSFSEIFEVIQKKTSWIIQLKSKINSTILSQYSELTTDMSIRKVGVSYGRAVLTIRLPELSFSKEIYSASYVVDDEDVANIEVESIKIVDVDEDYVEVSLLDYSDYFKITLKSGVCTVSLAKPLPSEITHKYGTLVSNLVASRKSDSRTLATSTLVIALPDAESTDVPKFSSFSYYGEYINSDTPTVELEQSIELAYDNKAVVESVKIDNSSGYYASNFEVKKKDHNTYIVEVVEPLAQKTLNTLTTVVLTLVANSTQNSQDYAALVIVLPKSVRNSSVQVEDQEILFSGTYDDGDFSSPKISLEFANSTKDSDVAVAITNDVGINNKYFHSSYSSSKKLLTIQIDPLSDDLVSDISVIPLKLAITDRSTQDTIFAVLNVKITNSNSGGVTTDTHPNLGLIVAVSILAGLLVLLLVAAFIYWFYKIRKANKSATIVEEPKPASKTSLFTKNETKKSHGSLSSASLRRPTGLGIGVVDSISEDTSTDGVDETPEDSLEVERKVAFDDNVEKIDIDDEAQGFQSVANRRPTKFVFGYPLESDLFNNTSDDRRESSDYNVDIPEEQKIPLDLPEKKSVAFDENIERMDIDPVEEDDSDDEEEGEEDQEPTQHSSEAEQHVTDEEKLPSQIFKEIF